MNNKVGQKWDNLYMDMAERISQMSHCKRRQVGAVIVKNNNVISFGYNGTPSGFDDCCEIDDNTTKPEVVHSELNCISKCARQGISCDASTMYITMSPCYECSKAIIQSGISMVIYKEVYRDMKPIEFLEQAGIVCYKIDD